MLKRYIKKEQFPIHSNVFYALQLKKAFPDLKRNNVLLFVFRKPQAGRTDV